MKTGALLKWGLVIAGLYLAWRSGIFQRLGLTFLPLPPGGTATPAGESSGGGGGTAVPPADQLKVTDTKTGGGGQVTTPAPSTFLSPEQIDALTKKAAGGDVVAAAQATALGVRYNGHQWNWFREQAGNPPAPATPGLDDLMTASEYLAYRAAQGLAGLSLAGIPLAALTWGRN